ncbi:hypothetical protein M9H77_28404 [Catharanthus roseus]|uniref:Uncharacterized protein n=1 Tax=Catharanthus roseus TaxID=4058 RepID=A0ACC0AJD6_CATRO|nr:hypothetical protein M9H77_28404 [Catharanthus roseus]
MDELVEEMPDVASLTVIKGEDGITLEDGWEKFWDNNNLSPGEALGKDCSTHKRNMSWEDISLALNKERGIYFSVSQLKICWRKEKLIYKAWSKLVSATSSTYYDTIENKVNWSEQQWEEYLKQFFERSLENLTEMMCLFDA